MRRNVLGAHFKMGLSFVMVTVSGIAEPAVESSSFPSESKRLFSICVLTDFCTPANGPITN